MSLDTQFINLNPLTLDGLTTISADSLNLNVGQGVLQSDNLGDIYASDTIICDTLEPRNNYINFTVNEPAILGVTMTPYIRNAITGSSSIDFNKGTGVISVTGGFASKWGQNGNTIYNNNTTGSVAISNLSVSGTGVVYGGLEAYTYLVSYATLFSNGSTRLQGSLTVTGGSTFNGNLRIISGGLHVTGGVSMNEGLSVSGGLRVTGNSTFNQNLTVNGGIGVGQAPFGGVHRLNTKGRIRATAFDGTDSSGVIETVSNMGYINYLYTADNGKAYYDGTTDGLNIQIGLSANNGLQVNGSSVHNSGIYVVGGSEINGGLQIQSGLNVVGGNSTFNNGLTVTFNPLIVGAGMFVTGGTSRFGKDLSISGTLNVSGGANYANQRIVISNTGTYTSVGDIRLGRTPNSLTEGRLLTISFGTGTAGPTTQGILFADATTPFDTGIYGGQQQLYFNAGGSQRMSIGANVNFTTAPYVGGSPITTDSVAEGTRLYYTDSRARNAISASSPLFYDNTTGVLSLPSGNLTNEWRQSNQAPATGQYYQIARMRYNADGQADGGLQINGIIGGYLQTNTSKFDLAINTRGSTTPQIYGSLDSPVATLATVIGICDFVMYENTVSGVIYQDIYIHMKANQFYSFDILVNGTTNGVILYNPSYTPLTTTPSGTLKVSSILSQLEIYTIAGQVNIGTSTNETNVGLKSFKATGGSKIKVESNSASDAEFWARNTVSSYAWYAHNSVNSMRLYNYGTSTDLMTVLSNGTVGVGITNPITRLEVLQEMGTRSSTNQGLIRLLSVNNENYIQSGLTYTSGSSAPLIFSNMYYGSEWARFDATGKLGIGNRNPQFLLSLSANTDTTAHIKSNSTTGYAQMFLQCDNASLGGGIFLNGSSAPTDPNMLFVENEIGNIYLLPKQNISYNFGRFQINTNTAYDTNGNAVLQFRDGAGDMGYFYMNNSDNTFISTLPIKMPAQSTISGAPMFWTTLRNRGPYQVAQQPTALNPSYDTATFTIKSSTSSSLIMLNWSNFTTTVGNCYLSVSLYRSTGVFLESFNTGGNYFNSINFMMNSSWAQVLPIGNSWGAGDYFLRIVHLGTGHRTDNNCYMNVVIQETQNAY